MDLWIIDQNGRKIIKTNELTTKISVNSDKEMSIRVYDESDNLLGTYHDAEMVKNMLDYIFTIMAYKAEQGETSFHFRMPLCDGVDYVKSLDNYLSNKGYYDE